LITAYVYSFVVDWPPKSFVLTCKHSKHKISCFHSGDWKFVVS